jgi:putative drug exporter of the RND superfamily
MAHAHDADADPVRRGLAARAFAYLTAGPLSLFIVLAWIVAAVLAAYSLPGFDSNQSSLADLTPANAPAVAAERQAAGLFGVPILSRVAVVQRAAGGLSPATQRATVAAALGLDSGTSTAPPGLLGAFPLVNDPALVPGAGEHGTTAITYLFFDPALSWPRQVREARLYAARDLGGASVVGVTGSVPGRLAQEEQIAARLTAVEIATVAVVVLVIALTFGSVVAPLVTLLVGGLAYVLASRLVSWAGGRYGFTPPPELDPLIVVLLLGIVTDYVIFYLTGFRERLRAGEPRAQAARRATAQYTPIILTAGLTVAAGTAALMVARQPFFRDFGPGLALSVIVGLVVAVTLVPALLAIIGRGIFWPRRIVVGASAASAATAVGPAAGSAAGAPAGMGETPPQAGRAAPPATRRGLRTRLAHVATHRAGALAIVVICVALLLAAASGLRVTRLGLDFLSGLPAGSEARRAAEAAATGFAPGILAPTQVVVRKAGISSRESALTALERGIAAQPGVAGVAGPREQAAAPGLAFATSQDGSAARYLVVFDADPLGSAGIARYDHLRGVMPALLARAGLRGAEVQYGGDTALAQYAIGRTLGDLGRIGIAVCLLDFLLLAVFLRALFAPLYLVAASVLALAAALGLTAYLFQVVLGSEDLSYYVPFAASVLLISLGSDYNVFLVGRIWEERRRRPLRGAIETAVPRARRPISVAALALTLSFATLAFVDLAAFRELAFLLAVGILVDSFFVRSVFVPALVALFGRRHIEETGAQAAPESPPVAGRRAA